MTTSIWTIAELDAQISAYKAALLAVSAMQSYQMDTGLTKKTVTHADLPEIRSTLKYLQNERAALAGSSGPQFLSVRPPR